MPAANDLPTAPTPAAPLLARNAAVASASLTPNAATHRPARMRLIAIAAVAAAGLLHSALMFAAFDPLGWWPLALVALLPLFAIAYAAGTPHLTPAAGSETNLTGSLLSQVAWSLRSTRPRVLLISGWLAVLPFWAANQWWVMEVSAPGAPILMLIEASWSGLFLWAATHLQRKRPRASFFILPILWTAIEFIRGDLFGHGYAWSLIAYPLIDCTPLAAPASIAGVYVVTLLTCIFTGLLLCLLLRRLRTAAIHASIWLLGLLAWFALPAAPAIPRPFTVAAVQTNVPQGTKLAWTFEQELAEFSRLSKLSLIASLGRFGVEPALSSPDLPRPAAATIPDVIVWPETMMPGITLEAQALDVLAQDGIYFRKPLPTGGSEPIPATVFATYLEALSATIPIPFLVGEDARINLSTVVESDTVDFVQDRRYNSVYLYQAAVQSQTRYDKVRLTPFGETMPYIASIPGLQQKLLDLGARGMSFDLNEGGPSTPFLIPDSAKSPVRAVTPICFEITVGPYVRTLAYRGWPFATRSADVIINVTNDGWFGRSDSTRSQHLQIARWRALELSTPVVRSANTGISVAIDARGGLLHSLPPRAEGVLNQTLLLNPTPSIYGQIGNFLPWSTIVASLLLWLWPRRTYQPRQPQPSTSQP